MARCMNDAHGDARDLEVLTVGRKCVRGRSRRHVVAEPHACRDRHRIGDRQVALVQQERRAGGFDDGSCRHDVVQVCVTGDDARDAHTHIASQREDLFGLVTRIDDTGFTATPRADDPAVFLEESDDDTAHLELDRIAGHQPPRVARWASSWADWPSRTAGASRQASRERHASVTRRTADHILRTSVMRASRERHGRCHVSVMPASRERHPSVM